MIIKPNLTGTHVHKEKLKIRIDFLPEPTDAIYPFYHVRVNARPLTENEIKLMGDPSTKNPPELNIPKVWQVNPVLCHHLQIPETFNKEELQEYLARLCNTKLCSTIQSYITRENSADYICPLMRGQKTYTREKIVTKDTYDLVNSTNQLIRDIEFGVKNGNPEIIKPESIDVGFAATNRASYSNNGGYTVWSIGNPANDTGTIDTVEVWLYKSADDLIVGMVYGSDPYDSRDHESLGAVASGSKHTDSGTDIDVATNDMIGNYAADAYANEKDNSGDGYSYIQQAFPLSNDNEDGTIADRTQSLYGTGTKSGVSFKPLNVGII